MFLILRTPIVWYNSGMKPILPDSAVQAINRIRKK